MENGTPLLQDVFRYQQTGRQGRKQVGDFHATGVVPRLVHELRERGVEVPLNIFQRHNGDDV